MQSIGTIQRSFLTSPQLHNLKERQRRTKVAKIYYFVSGIPAFSFDWHAKMYRVPTDFFSMKWFTKG